MGRVREDRRTPSRRVLRVTFKKRRVGTIANDSLKEILGEIVQPYVATQMSTPPVRSTRSSAKKLPHPTPNPDNGASPALQNKKRKASEEKLGDEPKPKRMAENQILEAIKGIKTSVNSMEKQMKTFSTKADLDSLFGEIKEVRGSVNANTGRIEKLFQLRKEDENNISKKVEEILDGRTNTNGHGGHETRFLESRRSVRLWPVSSRSDLEEAVRHFLVSVLRVPADTANNLPIELVKKQDQMRRSKIHDEVLVRFTTSQARDVVQSYAVNLSEAGGTAGLRLDVPDHLRGLFRLFEVHAAALRDRYGTVKRAIRFDDTEMSLYMDVKLGHTGWHRISGAEMRGMAAAGKAAKTSRTNDPKMAKEKREILLQPPADQEQAGQSVPVIDSDSESADAFYDSEAPNQRR